MVASLKNIIDLCKSEEMPWYVIGNGSNLLVSDRGFRGVIIQLFKNFSDLRVEGDRLYVQAGTLLSRTAKKALEASLTGFEFAAGIPGTIGGAMVMNAGAYGGEMKDVTEEVTVLTEKGEVKTLKREDLTKLSELFKTPIEELESLWLANKLYSIVRQLSHKFKNTN